MTMKAMVKAHTCTEEKKLKLVCMGRANDISLQRVL